jgi:glycosyltransferase involved in cell wall biosynthesis
VSKPNAPVVVPFKSPSFASRDSAKRLPIVVHSHLRWDFVWQRPQQILARLSPHHRIAFIEEPLYDGADITLAIIEPMPNVVRIVPHIPQSLRTGVDAECAMMLPHLQRAFGEHPLLAGRFQRVIQWFYSPTVAPPFLGMLDAAAVVYDCMDELANFRFAPADLPQREAALLTRADVVFTGGYQLYSKKSKGHRNVHFYGCGVDVDHYEKARRADTPLPSDVASLPRPVLGYFGVIDERLDYELIDSLATAFLDGSIVMVGPLAKIDPAVLPRRSNVHWLGQRSYDELPAYVKAFDVCLMPFALNDATQNINPTKTLEYMAAGKPVVSTAVPDVVRNFTPIVQVARSSAEFVKLARLAAQTPNAEMLARGLERACAATWDSVVAAMREHTIAAVRARQPAAANLAATA